MEFIFKNFKNGGRWGQIFKNCYQYHDTYYITMYHQTVCIRIVVMMPFTIV